MCDLYICRICLNTAVRGYKLEEHSLHSCYEFILQERLSSKKLLPQWVCYECAMLLHKFHKFKEKCLRGQLILDQISLRGKITSESVAVIDRYSENLTSSIKIARSSKHVQSITIKYNKNNIKTEKMYPNKQLEAKVSLRNGKNINSLSTTSYVKQNRKADIRNSNYDVNNDIVIDNSLSSDDEKMCDKDLVKHESINEEEIIIPMTHPSTDQIKSEIPNSLKINRNFSKKSGINNLQNTINHKENDNSDLEDTYDFDTSFNSIDNEKFSDDESLMNIAKKRCKIKHETGTHKTKTKLKKTKTVDDKEVVLKNTKPLKLVLNSQFWKKINLCEEEAVREFKQREFNNDYFLKAKYKCHDCFKGFSRHEMLDRHLRQRHDESCGNFECRFCHMRFRHRHQLMKHIREHLIIYNCLICKLQCTRISSALQHQEQHKGTKKTCKHCGKQFNHLSTYYTHVRMSHRSAHVCVACGASFVSEHGLLMHTRLMHSENLKQLEEEIRKRSEASNKAENTSNKLSVEQPTVESVKSAPDTEEIYCEKCDIKFMSRRAYNMHFFKSDNHDDGDANAARFDLSGRGTRRYAKIPTTCSHCNKEFPTRVAYQRHHLSEHSHIPLIIPKKRDICEVCGASVQMGSIQYHMKSHTGEREFACPAPDCGLRFTLKRNMQRHYNVKHLGMPSPKYVRRNPGKRKKKNQDILENDFSPFVRTRTGYFL